MGTEYFYVDTDRKEYFEIGKGAAQNLCEMLKNGKQKGITCVDLWQDLEKDSWIQTLKSSGRFDYLFWLKGEFIPKLYSWINENSKCLSEYDLENFPFNEFKEVGSRYVSENTINSFIKDHIKEYLLFKAELGPIANLRDTLERIRRLCLEINLENLDHDDRDRLYDIMFDEGLIDQALFFLNKTGL